MFAPIDRVALRCRLNDPPPTVVPGAMANGRPSVLSPAVAGSGSLRATGSL